jgi:rare lipoprotein A
MQTHTRLRRVALVVLMSAVLAACAAHRSPSPTVTASPQASGAGKGGYKVGQPYQIEGVWYYPGEDFSYDETGIASWYGEQFHGRYTANGEVFDLNSVTAAHRTLPMPTVVEVTNLENGRVIQVRVNDRGPYARGRIIDLSRRSAQLLGFEQQGTAKVRVRILVPESIQVASLAGRNSDEAKALSAVDPPKPAPSIKVATEPLAPPPGVRVEVAPPVAQLPRPAPTPPPPPEATLVASAAPPHTVPVAVVPVKATQIYIQAGAFAKPDNAYRVKNQLDPLGAVKVSGVHTKGIDVYRVRLGPIPSVEEADRLLAQVVGTGLTEARIVVD